MIGPCLKETVSPPSGIQGIIQSGLTVRAWRYGTKGVGVLTSLFCTVGKQSIGQCQVARYLSLALVLVLGSIVLWGFHGDFLPVIQKGESNPLGVASKESAP